MDRSDLMTLKAVLLYILENGGDKIRRNVYYIVKAAYFAQQDVAEAISFDEEVFLPKETVDMDWLSKSNIDCLKEAIAEVSAMSFEQILQASHGKEWQRAYDSDRVMDYVEILMKNHVMWIVIK